MHVGIVEIFIVQLVEPMGSPTSSYEAIEKPPSALAPWVSFSDTSTMYCQREARAQLIWVSFTLSFIPFLAHTQTDNEGPARVPWKGNNLSLFTRRLRSHAGRRRG